MREEATPHSVREGPTVTRPPARHARPFGIWRGLALLGVGSSSWLVACSWLLLFGLGCAQRPCECTPPPEPQRQDEVTGTAGPERPDVAEPSPAVTEIRETPRNRSARTVQVLGFNGAPLPHVAVWLRRTGQAYSEDRHLLGITRLPGRVEYWGPLGETWDFRVETDGQGVFRVPSKLAAISSRCIVNFSGSISLPTVLRPGDETLQVNTGLPVALRCLDSATGEPVACVGWYLGLYAAVLEKAPRSWSPDERHGVGASAGGGWRSGLWLDPPPGYVVWESGYFECTVSRRARSLLVMFPLAPEAAISVAWRARDKESSSHAEVLMPYCPNGGHYYLGLPSLGGEGASGRLHGVPHFPHGGVTLLLDTTRGGDSLDWRFIQSRIHPETSGSPGRAYRSIVDGARTRELRFGGEREHAAVVIVEERDPASTARLVFPVARDLEVDGSCERPPLEGRPSFVDGGGEIQLTVLDRDGAPVGDVRVQGPRTRHATNARGRLRVGRLPDGRHEFCLCEPGMVQTSAVVEVGAGETVRAELREGHGGTLVVHVVDAEGAPLPHARLRLLTETGNLPPRWFDESRGVQRLDWFCDRMGRLELPHLDVGRLRVSATWAELHGESEGCIAEEKRTEIRIVARSRGE